MLTLLAICGIVVAMVAAFAFGILFGRKNPKKVEMAVSAAQDPKDALKKVL